MSDITRCDAFDVDPSTTGSFPPVQAAHPTSGPRARSTRRTRRSLIAAAALSIGLLTGTTAFAAPAQAGIIGGVNTPELAIMNAAGILQTPTISVTGTGTVSVEPDVAKLSFAVEADGEDAVQAADSANAAADAVNVALEQMGLPKEDIQTGGVSVAPRYVYDDAGNSTVGGYHANVQYDLSGVAVADVSTVLGGVLDAGVTQVYTIAYYSSTYDEQYQEALAQAVAQAKAKANALLPTLTDSDDASLTLKGVTESPSSMQYRYADAGSYATMDAAASGSEQAKVGSTVVPGTIEIEASVTVEYGLFDPSGFEKVMSDAVASADAQMSSGAVQVGATPSASASSDAK